MSKIFELFGYRLDQWGPAADANRAKAWCPFMDAECDGGGNRHSSAIDLRKHKDLRKFFPKKKEVQSGVCSLRIVPDEQPWIVCPRRLFSLRAEAEHAHHKRVKDELVRRAGLPANKRYRAWSEVKMKVETTTDADEEKFFDYTFDYIVTGSQIIKLSEVAQMIGKTDKMTKRIAKQNGYTLSRRGGQDYIDNFPGDPVIIVEIMTSSTSGGSKDPRSKLRGI